MSRREPKDLAASIRQRLLNLARERGEDFQLVLIHYAVERFLYRLSRSRYAECLVLKGAMLFSAWDEVPRRPTRDLDLLGFGDDAVASVERVVTEIVRTEVEADGLVFDEGSIRGEEIREDQEYGGVRVRLQATLAGARIPLQVDVAFGDVVSPEPQTVEYPTLLDLAAPPAARLSSRADGRRKVPGACGAWDGQHPNEGLLRSLDRDRADALQRSTS